MRSCCGGAEAAGTLVVRPHGGSGRPYPRHINIPLAELADRLAELTGDRHCRLLSWCLLRRRPPMPSASRATQGGKVKTPRRRNARMAISRTAGRRDCTGQGSVTLIKIFALMTD